MGTDGDEIARYAECAASIELTRRTERARWKYSSRKSHGTPSAFRMLRLVACRHDRPFSIA
jgi:hypothetical protein